MTEPPTHADDHPSKRSNSASSSGETAEYIEPTQFEEITTGEAIAVRAIADEYQTIVAGRVGGSVDAPTAELTADQGDANSQAEDSSEVTLVLIDAEHWWVLSEGEVRNRSQLVRDRPPMQPQLGDQPEPAPTCSLTYSETGEVNLVIPMPVSNGSRVRYYVSEPHGAVVEFKYDSVVAPEQVLPNGYVPPEHSP